MGEYHDERLLHKYSLRALDLAEHGLEYALEIGVAENMSRATYHGRNEFAHVRATVFVSFRVEHVCDDADDVAECAFASLVFPVYQLIDRFRYVRS